MALTKEDLSFSKPLSLQLSCSNLLRNAVANIDGGALLAIPDGNLCRIFLLPEESNDLSEIDNSPSSGLFVPQKDQNGPKGLGDVLKVLWLPAGNSEKTPVFHRLLMIIWAGLAQVYAVQQASPGGALVAAPLAWPIGLAGGRGVLEGAAPPYGAAWRGAAAGGGKDEAEDEESLFILWDSLGGLHIVKYRGAERSSAITGIAHASSPFQQHQQASQLNMCCCWVSEKLVALSSHTTIKVLGKDEEDHFKEKAAMDCQSNGLVYDEQNSRCGPIVELCPLAGGHNFVALTEGSLGLTEAYGEDLSAREFPRILPGEKFADAPDEPPRNFSKEVPGTTNEDHKDSSEDQNGIIDLVGKLGNKSDRQVPSSLLILENKTSNGSQSDANKPELIIVRMTSSGVLEIAARLAVLPGAGRGLLSTAGNAIAVATAGGKVTMFEYNEDYPGSPAGHLIQRNQYSFPGLTVKGLALTPPAAPSGGPAAAAAALAAVATATAVCLACRPARGAAAAPGGTTLLGPGEAAILQEARLALRGGGAAAEAAGAPPSSLGAALRAAAAAAPFAAEAAAAAPPPPPPPPPPRDALEELRRLSLSAARASPGPDRPAPAPAVVAAAAAPADAGAGGLVRTAGPPSSGQILHDLKKLEAKQQLERQQELFQRRAAAVAAGGALLPGSPEEILSRIRRLEATHAETRRQETEEIEALERALKEAQQASKEKKKAAAANPPPPSSGPAAVLQEQLQTIGVVAGESRSTHVTLDMIAGNGIPEFEDETQSIKEKLKAIELQSMIQPPAAAQKNDNKSISTDELLQQLRGQPYPKSPDAAADAREGLRAALLRAAPPAPGPHRLQEEKQHSAELIQQLRSVQQAAVARGGAPGQSPAGYGQVPPAQDASTSPLSGGAGGAAASCGGASAAEKAQWAAVLGNRGRKGVESREYLEPEGSPADPLNDGEGDRGAYGISKEEPASSGEGAEPGPGAAAAAAEARAAAAAARGVAAAAAAELGRCAAAVGAQGRALGARLGALEDLLVGQGARLRRLEDALAALLDRVPPPPPP